MQASDGLEEHRMRVNLKHKAAEIEEIPNQDKTDLSRRTFLYRLTILGVGCAAAMTLGVREADATTETDAAGKAKDLAALAEGKKAEFVDGVDPDDPLEISAQVRRRVARRRVRRVRRRVLVRRGVARRRVRSRVLSRSRPSAGAPGARAVEFAGFAAAAS
jgi:hypothetical protein